MERTNEGETRKYESRQLGGIVVWMRVVVCLCDEVKVCRTLWTCAGLLVIQECSR